MAPLDEQAELLRVRDRLHSFINTVAGRLGEHDVEMGKLTVHVNEIEERLAHYTTVTDELVKANAIAAALSDHLRGSTKMTFSRWQIGLAVVAVCTPYVLFGLAAVS